MPSTNSLLYLYILNSEKKGRQIFPLYHISPRQICSLETHREMRYNENMKIQGPNKTSASASSKKASKAGGGNFGVLINDGGAEEASSTATAHSITKVEALLVAQTTDDPAAHASKGRMMMRADRLLEELDHMRLSMLTGSLTVGHMIDIADVVASHKENIHDPELTAILTEIDLRAQVEIAKMRVSLDALG